MKGKEGIASVLTYLFRALKFEEINIVPSLLRVAVSLRRQQNG